MIWHILVKIWCFVILASASSSVSWADNSSDFLAPEEAFQGKILSQSEQTITLEFQAAPAHYLYQKQFEFRAEPESVRIISVEFSAGEEYFDPVFNENMWIHRAPVTITLKYETPNGLDTFQLHATYQGCSDKGLCYAPMQKTWKIDPSGMRATENAKIGELYHSDFTISSILQNSSFWASIALFFGFGVLLSFTPCVLPMLPILSAIIIGKDRQDMKNRRFKSFILSFAYVLGMSIVYTAAGVAAGVSGIGLAGYFQNVWFLIPFALILGLLALAMFDVLHIQMPQTIQNKLTTFINTIPGGYYLGSFITGAISALIVGPCVAAPLAGALLYISTTQDVVLGGSALFAMSWGMGVPLLIAGMSAGSILPKAGQWMLEVKGIFGVSLLMVAWWILSPILADSIYFFGWACLSLLLAMYFGLYTPLPTPHQLRHKVLRVCALVLCFVAIVLMIGAVTGARNIYHPLEKIVSTQTAVGNDATDNLFVRVRSIEDIQQSIQMSTLPVIVDVYADWCVSCKEMEMYTFSERSVRDTMQKFTRLQIDITQYDVNDQKALKTLGIVGAPSMLFYAPGKLDELRAFRLVGFLAASPFQEHLERVLADIER